MFRLRTSLMPNIQSRYLSLSSMRQVIGSGKPPAEAPVAASGAPSNANSAGEGVRPSNFEKKMLVWTKKYKAEAEIPETLSFETIDRARNRFRIKVANILMVLTIVGCIAMIVSGKKAAERGEFVAKQNLDWHAAYNEQQSKKENVGKK